MSRHALTARTRGTVAAQVVSIVALQGAAFASFCPPPQPDVFPTRPEATDAVPPPQPEIADVIFRVLGEEGGCKSDSCDHVAQLEIYIRAPDQEVGHKVYLIAGTPPPGLDLSGGPYFGDPLVFSWVMSDPPDITIAVAAVDRAGNVSTISAPHIVNTTDDSSGCFVTAGGQRGAATGVGSLIFAIACITALRRQSPRIAGSDPVGSGHHLRR